MTQLEAARAGIITDEMRLVAAAEQMAPEELRRRVAAGRVVIPKNRNRDFEPRGIGEGLRTKVNVNIGHSGHHQSLAEELEKLRVAVKHGTDSVMDLSTGEELDATRQAVLEESPVMVGTVPIYQVGAEKPFVQMTAEDLLSVIEKQAKQGVDYMTIHCGVTRESVRRLEEDERTCGIVSRGGSIHAAWIRKHGRENPLYERFDDFLEIAREHDVTLSLGDGLRPGAIADATDGGQVAELLVLGELTQRAWDAGVQVMIEGPGHVPLDEIVANVQLQKQVCKGAPFYVLGPLVTDVAPGYDHITGCVGGAIAAAHGADFLCDVTPAEHLRLPTLDDIRDGTVATRIAAHSGDLVKGVKGAREWDRAMSERRKALDWEGMYRLAMDPWKARQLRMESEAYDQPVCTMCGALCSINIDNAGMGEERGETAEEASSGYEV